MARHRGNSETKPNGVAAMDAKGREGNARRRAASRWQTGDANGGFGQNHVLSSLSLCAPASWMSQSVPPPFVCFAPFVIPIRWNKAQWTRHE